MVFLALGTDDDGFGHGGGDGNRARSSAQNRAVQSVTASDGRTLTVRESGDAAGFPVLTISGTPGSSTIYEPHARDAAERGIRLFSYDRPGV
jgi:pimeloyl-ACP methyl ester carboxylesterase